MRERPILVLRLTTAVSPARGMRVEAVRLLRQPLGRRVVLRAADLASSGLALVARLWRAHLRGEALPSTLALEINPGVPTHRAVLAAVLPFTDPTPATDELVRGILATEGTLEADVSELRAGSLWLGGLQRLAMNRLLGACRRSKRRQLVAATIERAANYWPRTKQEAATMGNLAHGLAAAQSTLPPTDRDIYLELANSRMPARIPSTTQVRHACRAASRPERHLLRALFAASVANYLAQSPQAPRARRLRAARHAHMLARRAGLRRLAATCSAFARMCTDISLTRAGYWRARRGALSLSNDAAWVVAAGVWQALCLVGHSPAARFSSPMQLYATRPGRRQANWGYYVPELRHVFHMHRIPAACKPTGPRGRLESAVADLRENRFRRCVSVLSSAPARERGYLHDLSLGMLGHDSGPARHQDREPGSTGYLVHAYQLIADGSADVRHRDSPVWSRESAVDGACTRVLCTGLLRHGDTKLLRQATGAETSWSRRIVVCLCLARVHMRRSQPVLALRVLGRAVPAYQGFTRLRSSLRYPAEPWLLADFRRACTQVLLAIEPSRTARKDPVRDLKRLAQRFPSRAHAEPQPAIDALDALAVAGGAVASSVGDTHLAQELARMLGGRVLLHYAPGGYVAREEQAVHTLSMWTIRRLVAAEGLKVWSVRRRPELWRPEQRRPRGLLRVPLGAGCAVIARGRRFRPDEVKAVRAVMRFFALRTATPPEVPVPRVPEPSGAPLKPTVAEGLIGRAPAWRRVLEQVQRVAPTDCSVVLHGETGTGKERLARAIHACSPRAHRAFVAVNCGALAPELVASELFGHVRGAFTGADRSRDGIFVGAHQGTLFLDEVGDMPATVQVALLRVLEERQVTPVGSVHARPVDVRIVCATHRDLEREVRAGRFREDLWHRLNVVTLELPPLRERLEDLPLLALHMLARMPGTPRLHPDATEVLARYRWPGNVRELENVLRAAALLADSPVLGPDLLERLLDGRRAALATQADPLPPRTLAVLDALGDRWLSTPELARKLGTPQRTLNRELARLVAQGLVRTSGQARASRYRRHS